MNKPIPSSEHIGKLPHRFQVAFALFCAKQVIHLVESKEAHECIRVVELWLDGKATADECKEVGKATYASANALNAAYHATHATNPAHAHVAYVAIYASYAAAVYNAAFAAPADYAYAAAYTATAANYADYADLKKAQWVFYEELLEFDATFEKMVLA